jgi:hypothetical protein
MTTASAATVNTRPIKVDLASCGPLDLPFLLPPRLTASLLDCSEKTLERRRRDGRDGIPFVKVGRKIYYPREHLLKYLEDRVVTSTAEAKRAAMGRAASRAQVLAA